MICQLFLYRAAKPVDWVVAARPMGEKRLDVRSTFDRQSLYTLGINSACHLVRPKGAFLGAILVQPAN